MRTPTIYILLLVALMVPERVVATTPEVTATITPEVAATTTPDVPATTTPDVPATTTPEGLAIITPESSLYDFESYYKSMQGWDELTRSDRRAWERSNKIKAKGGAGMVGGAIIAAAGIAVVGETLGIMQDVVGDANNEGNWVVGIFGVFTTSIIGAIGAGIATVGVVGILHGLPYYAWGAHMSKNDWSTFNIGSEYVGWRGMLELGLAVAPSADIAYGYNYKDLFVGAGAGYTQHLQGADNFGIPAYLNVRWQISRSRVAPFLGAKAGFDFYNQTPYWAIDWGTRVRCKHSPNSWWFSMSLFTHNARRGLGLRAARSF